MDMKGKAAGAVVVVLALAFLYLSIPTPHKQAGGSGTAVQQASQLAVNGTPFSSIITNITHNVSRESEFNVSYSGTVGLGLSGPNSTSPVSISYERYNGSSRLSINMTRSQIIGNISIVTINYGNGTVYECTGLTGQAALSIGGQGAESTCTQVQGGGLLNDTSIGPVSAGSLLPSSSYVGVSVEGQRIYNGMPCAWLHGSGTENLSVGNIDGYSVPQQYYYYNVSGCLSLKYYVPLNLSTVFYTGGSQGGTGGMSLDLHEVSIGLPTSGREVGTLPGNIVNVSSLVSGVGLGLSLNTSKACDGLFNYTCNYLNVSASGAVSMYFGQDTGETMYNLRMACVSGNETGVEFEGIGQLGAAERGYSGRTLASGSYITVTNLTCPGLPAPLAPGQAVKGTIVLNFTTTPSAAGSTGALPVPAALFSTEVS